MDFINQILPTEILQAIGWTVLHSLWQAFAVALLLAAYLLALQKTDSRKRYLAGNMALAGVLLLAFATFSFYLRKAQNGVLVSEVWGDDGTVLGQYYLETPSYFADYFAQHIPLIVTVWLLGMVGFLLRMLGGLLYVQQLKNRMTAQLPQEWQSKMQQLSRKLTIKKQVKLLESALAKTPMVVGWLKPVILLPVGAVNHLSAAQVEAILAHELAHIARHDYILNLLQSFIEVLFYFNPAIWWISKQIRTERENCCDDVAVKLCGNSLAYAKALVGLQEMQLATPQLAMLFARNKKHLLLRVQRILQPSQNKSNVMEKLSATLLLTVAVVLLSVQANTPFGNLITRMAAKALPLKEMAAPVVGDDAYLPTDTIPAGKRNGHVHYNDDQENIEFEIEDGNIVFLKVDGEEIAEADYGKYDGRIAEIMGNLPEPPAPPAVPDFEELGEMPAPPAPPAPPAMYPDMPAPAPPAPPVPPVRPRKITTERTGKGTSLIIDNADGSEPIKILVEDGKKGSIIINGQEIAGLKKGDKTIIMQDMPLNFDWDLAQLDGVNGDWKQFQFPDVEMPGFTPGDFRLEMPDMNVWNREEFRAMQERLREGNFSKDALDKYAKELSELKFSDEWKAGMEEANAKRAAELEKLQQDRQLRIEQRQEAMQQSQERAMEDARRSQERMREKMEKQDRERMQLEKERQRKHRSGSM